MGVTDVPHPLENYFEHYYPFKNKVVCTGIEDCRFLEARYSGLKFVRLTPNQKLPFNDNEFDMGFCNATIEHVGSREEQRLFLREFLRVCKKAMVATPNRWYPIELHTRLPLVHWFPPRIFRRLIKWMGYEFYSSEKNLNLLSAHQLLKLLQPGNFDIKIKRNYFLGLPSNILLFVAKRSLA
ncbi:MAG: class I SAM-dependent methyltransferase [Elusimicrobia bacterium]|nr:class I SAM-dependent methyltransferase [Candidatus Obscuribacterium magneticum]